MIKKLAWLLFISGLLLHGFIESKSSGTFSAFNVGVFILAMSPYGVLLTFLLKSSVEWVCLTAMFLLLVSDFFLYHAVFVNPTSSTAAISLLTAPIIYLSFITVGGLSVKLFFSAK